MPQPPRLQKSSSGISTQCCTSSNGSGTPTTSWSRATTCCAASTLGRPHSYRSGQRRMATWTRSRSERKRELLPELRAQTSGHHPTQGKHSDAASDLGDERYSLTSYTHGGRSSSCRTSPSRAVSAASSNEQDPGSVGPKAIIPPSAPDAIEKHVRHLCVLKTTQALLTQMAGQGAKLVVLTLLSHPQSTTSLKIAHKHKQKHRTMTQPQQQTMIQAPQETKQRSVCVCAVCAAS